MRKRGLTEGVSLVATLTASMLLGAIPVLSQQSPVNDAATRRQVETGRKAPDVADAAMRRDMKAVRQLIAKGADVNTPQGDGMTALHWAAEHADTALAKLLLRSGAKVTPATRIGNYTPLHLASKSGSPVIVKSLLAAGADVKATTTSGSTPLHLAAESGNVDAVNALLDHQADPNARELEWGQTPLVFAAENDRGEVIAALLKHGADPSARTRVVSLTEQATIEAAATKRRNEVIQSYLPKSAKDSAAKTDSGKVSPVTSTPDPSAGTPAAAAAAPGGRGAAPDLGAPQTSRKLTPSQIQEAIAEGRKILVAGAPPGTKVEEDTTDGQVAGYAGSVGNLGGLSPLHHAVRQGNLAAVTALLEGGADVNEPSAGDSTTPLLLATINGQFDAAMKLIEKGANPNLASTAGATPLYATLNAEWSPKSRFPQPEVKEFQKASYMDVMNALLKAGANPNTRIKQHLWYFAFNNCGNANCGLENLEGTTPFWRAAYAVDVAAMRLLKKYGADPDIPSKPPVQRGRGGGRGGRGAAPAAGATAAGAPGAGQPGRAGGAGAQPTGGGFAGLDPVAPLDSAARNAPAGPGVFPIHAAAGVGYGNGFAGNSHRHAPDGWMPALKYLVEELHANVNERDNNGYTPLHHAAARGDNEMIMYLVRHGADVKAVARNGRTVVDMANGPVQRLRPFPETIALLERLGAKNNHRCVSC